MLKLMEFSKKSKCALEIKVDPYLNWNSNYLNFKNAQILYVASYWSPRNYKNTWAFYKNALLFISKQIRQQKIENRKQKEEKGKKET